MLGLSSATGFNVELQDELGGRIDGVDDPRGLLDRLLPEPNNRDDYPFLRSLDACGDTIFNRLEMPRSSASVPIQSIPEGMGLYIAKDYNRR